MNKYLQKLIFSFLLFTPGKVIAASDADCFLAENINTVGKAGTICAGQLIVSREILVSRIELNKYWIKRNKKKYFFGKKNNRKTIFTGQITNFNNLFKDKEKFNQDIGYWNTSNATTMVGMFRNAKKFNRNLKDWDVSKVESMSGMFRNAFVFNKDIGNWDTSNVKHFNRMFQQANKFNQDIGNWVVTSAESRSDFSMMFYQARNFKQSLNRWNVKAISQAPNKFAPTLSPVSKHPCWGSDGCQNERPILIDDQTIPTKGSFGVALDARLELTFNFDIQDGPGDIRLFKKDGTTVKLQEIRNVQKRSGTSSLSIDSNKIKVLDLTLEENTDYYVLIDNNAIKRKGTNYFFEGLSDKNRIYFSTRSEDNPPSFVDISSSVDLVNNPKISIQFNEDIELGNGEIKLYSYTNDTDPIKTFKVPDDDSVSIGDTNDAVTIDLHDGSGNNIVDPNTKYYVLIDGKAIQDKAGNFFTGITSKNDISFTTGSSTCGLISGQYLDKWNNPVVNRNVKLYDSYDNLIETKATDTLGNYSFSPENPGTYKLKFDRKSTEQNKGIKARVMNVTSLNSGFLKVVG